MVLRYNNIGREVNGRLSAAKSTPTFELLIGLKTKTKTKKTKNKTKHKQTKNKNKTQQINKQIHT